MDRSSEHDLVFLCRSTGREARLASDDKSSAPSMAKKALTKKLSVPLTSKNAVAEENDPEKPGAQQHTNFNQKIMKLKNSAKNLFNNNNKQMDCHQSCELKKDLEIKKDDSRILQFPSGRQDSKAKNWLNKLSYKFTINEQTTSEGLSKNSSKITSWRSGMNCEDQFGKNLISAFPVNSEPSTDRLSDPLGSSSYSDGGMRMRSTDPSFPVLSEFHASELFRPMAVLPRSPSSPFVAIQSPELLGRQRRIKIGQGCVETSGPGFATRSNVTTTKLNDQERLRTGFVGQNSAHQEPQPLGWHVYPQRTSPKTSHGFHKVSTSSSDSSKLKPAFLFPSNSPLGATRAPASTISDDCKRSSFEQEVFEPFDRYKQSKVHAARQHVQSSKTHEVPCTDDVPLLEEEERIGRGKTCHSFGDILDELDFPDCERFHSEGFGGGMKIAKEKPRLPPKPRPFCRKDDSLQLSKGCYESLDVGNCQKQVFHVVTLNKCELDRANKDVQNKVIPSDFQVSFKVLI